MSHRYLKIYLLVLLLALVGCPLPKKTPPQKDIRPPFGDVGSIFRRDG